MESVTALKEPSESVGVAQCASQDKNTTTSLKYASNVQITVPNAGIPYSAKIVNHISTKSTDNVGSIYMIRKRATQSSCKM
jgi:hypothetical protein